VSPPRDSAVDAVRAIAILGMFVIHAVLVLGAQYLTSGFEAAVLWICDGRAAATFVTLAGFGVATLWARAPEHERDALLRKRALVLWVAGVLNLVIWPGDILRLYGVALALAPMLLRWSPRRRLIAAMALVGLFPLVASVIDWTTHWDLSTLTYLGTWTLDGFVRNLLYDGFRPLLPWLAFFLVGTVMAAWPLREARVQRQLIGWGSLATIVSVGASAGLDAWLQSAAPQMDALTREGVVGTTSLPPLPLFMLSAFGTTAILLGAGYALVPRLGGFWRDLLSATGRRALTWYVWHIVVLMSAAAAGALHTISAAQAIAVGLLLFAVAAAWSYRHRDRAGMLEQWMRRASAVSTQRSATVS
jgi:uncharacterized membrane protein YeiB